MLTPHPVPPSTIMSNIYTVSQPVHTHTPTTVPSHVLSFGSLLGARPLIRLDLPSFGDSAETADVLNFIEQCENFDIQPLPNAELMGTLSTVLGGPALSWWKAERTKVHDWRMFKDAFMTAFLLEDYLAETKGKLRAKVQQPGRSHEISPMIIALSVQNGGQISPKRNW